MGRRGITGKNSKQTAEALIKSEQAVQLRAAGLSYESIAKQLGIPRSTAFDAVDRALNLKKNEVAKDAEGIRAAMLIQLDELHKRWWPAALGLRKLGETIDPPPDRFALDRVLKIMDRRMALVGLVDITIDPTNFASLEAMRAKTESYKSMGIAELTKLFQEIVKSPVVMEKPVLTLEHKPQPSSPPEAVAAP